MATVWRAEDPLLGRSVALKVLTRELSRSPEARRRFQREAHLAQMLDHPAIAPVFEFGESGGTAWIAMALVEGCTLTDRIAQGLLPVSEACRIASAVGGALAYAHARGVLHRDVTPRNIMLARDGRVLLLDFGLAMVIGATRITRTGQMPGTLPYMAPESFVHSSEDPRSDLYSLAVVCYEMFTGSLPHSGENSAALAHAKWNVVPRPAGELRPGLPRHLEQLLERTLARDPVQRPADADEFVAGLTATESSATPCSSAGRHAAELLSEGAGVVYLGIPALEVASPDVDALGELAESLAMALRRRLGTPGQLHVVPGTEALGPDCTPLAWADRHGANLVLDVRVRRNGERVRVEFAVLDPFGGVTLAGDVTEGSRFDVLDLEDRLVAAARHSLPAGRDSLAEARTQPAGDAAALDHYAQAVRYLQRHDHEPSVDAAVEILERLTFMGGATAAQHAALARACLAKYALTRQHVWEARAASAVARAHELDGAQVAVKVALADVKSTAGHSGEAVRLYEQALTDDPSCLEGWLGLARVHLNYSRFDDAERSCRQALRLRPNDWRSYSMLGAVYFRQGQFARALPLWRRVLRLSPENARATSNLGATLYHLDRFEESEAAFRRAIAVEPGAAAYANLGTVLFAQHRFEDAMKAFEHACALRPADAQFWGHLGAAARQVPGHEDQARFAQERAIGLMQEHLERNPESAQSWAMLGSWLAVHGEPEQARAAQARARELAPDDMRVLIESAHTFAVMGDAEHALDLVERALHAGYGVLDLERSLDLQPLHALPRFQALLEEARRHRACGGRRHM